MKAWIIALSITVVLGFFAWQLSRMWNPFRVSPVSPVSPATITGNKEPVDTPVVHDWDVVHDLDWDCMRLDDYLKKKYLEICQRIDKLTTDKLKRTKPKEVPDLEKRLDAWDKSHNRMVWR